MASPYKCRVNFFLDDTGEELFHELDGTEFRIREGDTIFLNDVEYKVEKSTLYLYDNNYTNPISGIDEWAMKEEYCKIEVSLVV